jgi:hypothetical protein
VEIEQIRECVRQLRSTEVKPAANGVYIGFMTEEASTVYFIIRNFPSWLQYV